jgi:hypothetical protein
MYPYTKGSYFLGRKLRSHIQRVVEGVMGGYGGVMGGYGGVMGGYGGVMGVMVGYGGLWWGMGGYGGLWGIWGELRSPPHTKFLVFMFFDVFIWGLFEDINRYVYALCIFST